MPSVSNWQCPHCLQWSSLDDEEYSVEYIRFQDNKDQLTQLRVHSVVCKNNACRKLTLLANVYGKFPARAGSELRMTNQFQLIPSSKAKPQPSYIPPQIVIDYNEASLIAGLSPKASATLSRRCLQGMIRDFFKISRKTLYAEITAIKEHTPVDVWDAIDAVRKIGNIGAHMEQDINVIVDVDEDEARLLLSLIEQLFDDWYVTRHRRQERLQAIINTASEKDSQKQHPASALPDSPQTEDPSGAPSDV